MPDSRPWWKKLLGLVIRPTAESGAVLEVKSVICQVALLPRPLQSPEASQRIVALEEKLRTAPKDIISHDVLCAHLSLLQLLPLPDVQRKVHSLRSEFRVLAGPAVYGDYVTSAPPPIATSTLEVLQADARYLTRQLFGLYESLPRQEEWRNRLTLAGAALSLFVLSIGIWAYMYLQPRPETTHNEARQHQTLQDASKQPGPKPAHAESDAKLRGDSKPTASDTVVTDLPSSAAGDAGSVTRPNINLTNGNNDAPPPPSPKPATGQPTRPLSEFPMLIVVLLSGAFGGAVSTQQRIQRSTAFDSYPRVTAILLASRKVSIYVSPIMGALFASVLFALFLAGVIDGALFPEMFVKTNADPQSGSMSFAEFIEFSGPLNGIDVARLMIWSFVAGFAERLVPDTLDRLTSRFAQNAISAPAMPS